MLHFLLEGIISFFSVTDSNDSFHITDENFSIAHIIGMDGFNDDFQNMIYTVIGNDHAELDLRQYVQEDFGASVKLSPTLLIAAAHHLCYCDPVYIL
jgi:hypothetical protein